MIVALLVALHAWAGQPPRVALSAEAAEALVRRAQAAVESGGRRDSSERAAWTRRRQADAGDVAPRLALATMDRLTYRDADAERAYEALARDAGAGATAGAYALLGLGTLRAQQARLTDAEPLLRRAAAALKGAGARAGEAQALVALGAVTSRTAGVDSALRVYDAALRAVPAGDAWLRALAECNVLVARVRKADPAVARLARPTADAARRGANPRAAAACLTALAQDYERRTLIDSALATFDEVAALQRASRNLGGLAIARQWQGYVLYSLKGDLGAGRAALTEALALGARAGTAAAASWASMGLAELATTLGDLGAAGVYARTASDLFARTGDRWGAVQARMHQGDLALLARATTAARAAYEQVARDAPAVSASLAVHAHGRLAYVGLFEGDTAEAGRQLDEARRLAGALGMTAWREEDTYGRALLALQAGRLVEAQARLRAMDTILPPAALPERSDVLTRLAEVRAKAGDIDGAVTALVSSESVLERWRASLPARDLRAAVVQVHKLDWDRDLGFATAVNAIARGGRVEAAFRVSEWRRARVLLEELARRASLSSRGDGGVDAPAVRTEAEVRRVLPESTAVLVFLTGSGNEPTTVFVLARDGVVAADADAVDDHLAELDRFAGLVAAGDDPTELGRRLGAAFLDRALARVPNDVRHLVLVPDGPLHRAPFDLLRGRDGRALVDRYDVTLAPSASVAATWWTHAPRTPLPRLVAFGDPVGVRLDRATGVAAAADSTPPRLPAAAEEARRIGRFAPSAEVLVGAEASEARLRHTALADVGVLHFATHAQMDEWSLLRSALLLAPGGGDDGRVGVDELVGMRVGASLVVLSACRSGAARCSPARGCAGSPRRSWRREPRPWWRRCGRSATARRRRSWSASTGSWRAARGWTTRCTARRSPRAPTARRRPCGRRSRSPATAARAPRCASRGPTSPWRARCSRRSR
ncbi:CHAT domain protein [Gemmatirosa kalamazoonensis]|uniref:CHAT domain protein n=1 Tax=Gemmatirosa kalamazoonensis TaxID=861299 RepID=W0RCE0_9BACT|nr:CHAT domain-containing protein [Gemmatirosa kalamazoonensis]AHG88749.1 CHAT domain protein [Gemmatirosa kalamazoonensis]